MGGRLADLSDPPDESMAAFMDRRQKETTGGGAVARAAAYGAYGAAIRSGQDVRLVQPSDVEAYGARLGPGAMPPSPALANSTSATPKQAPPSKGAAANSQKPKSVGHPGWAESLVPVWGSGREAVADFQEGDYAGAALNGALAASDLFLAGDVAKAVAKGGMLAIKGPLIKEVGNGRNWKNMRATFGKKGLLDPGQHGHHWLIPNNDWGKEIPDWIKNHPLNIKGMPDAATHGRIHGRYGGMPQFNLLEQFWHGTPTWSKVAAADAVGHPVAAAEASHRP